MKIEVNKIMNPAFLLGTAFPQRIIKRKDEESLRKVSISTRKRFLQRVVG